MRYILLLVNNSRFNELGKGMWERILFACRVVVLLTGVVISGPAFSDEVEELIDEGRVAYSKGDMSSASEQLQNALNLIAELSVQSFIALIPEAPKGWAVEENSSEESALFTGIAGLIVATKRYKSIKTPAHTMQIALISNLPAFVKVAVGTMAGLQKRKTGASVVAVGGYVGSISCNPKGKCEVMIQVGDNALLTAESQGVAREVLVNLVKQVNLEKV
ncbi:hypothetical protein A9Q99_20900 [Gammaproteobacteria bacterium 45_16_T64]|nr:hypothetical protein A9Q99_20900 [Gammaproteobacteria bacterium 45_16_T64]